MSLEVVQNLEEELSYGPEDQQILKGIRLVWQRLDKLRQQAARDDKYLPAYRDLLTKSLMQARAQQPVDDPEAIAKEFWFWYDQQCVALGVARLERARGSDHQAWCEKWLPEDYRRFVGRVALTVEEPSQQRFEELREAAGRMLKAYTEAISCGTGSKSQSY
jgi:hypothetical protein